MTKFKVGVIGCGNISETYLGNLQDPNKLKYLFDVCALCDMNEEALKARAEQYNVPKTYTSIDEMLKDDEIDVVLNLTNPWAHYDLNMAALKAGKHVYCEKPLALTADQANELADFAESQGLALGCAPDVYLGAGQQTTRYAIESGMIGDPISAEAFIMMGVGNPRYLSARIGGQHLDMGPYFVGALVNLFGPVQRVSGATRRPHEKKFIDNVAHPDYGKEYDIEVETTIIGILEFANGVMATLITTNDGFGYGPKFEIHGTTGNLISSDPNMFTGKKSILTNYFDPNCNVELPDKFPYADEFRGLGMADMMISYSMGKKWRANARVATHIVDVLNSIIESAKTGARIDIKYQCEQPEAIKLNAGKNPIDPRVVL